MRRVLCCIVFLCASQPSACAQRVPVVSMGPPVQQAEMWQWTKSVWSDNDKALVAERVKLFALAKNKGALLRVIAQSGQEYPKTKSRFTLFRWGYAMYQARLRGWDPPEMGDLPYYLSSAKPPYDREFMRTRFLLHAGFSSPNKYLVLLGERLADTDPKDYTVIITLVFEMEMKTEAEKQKGLSYARSLLALQPKNTAGYSAMASCYKCRWMFTHDPDDMRQSIHWDEEYLKHGGTNPEFDKSLRTWVLPNDRKWLAEHTKH